MWSDRLKRQTPSSNESWLIEAGDDVVKKKASAGLGALSRRETVLYWLWCADYMMRNAGDFANAVVEERDFQQEIVLHARELGLRYTDETFSLPRGQLEKEYFDRFDGVCDEIRSK